MASTYAITKELLGPEGSRNIRIDDTPRSLVAMAKAYGRKPNRHENVAFKQFCINFVLRGRGRYTDAAGRNYELAPGTLFHRFPGVVHTTWYDPDSDYAEFFVVFDSLTGRQLANLGLLASDDQPLLTVGYDPVVLEEFKHLVKRINLPEHECRSRTMLLETAEFINGLYDRARSNRVLSYWEKIIEDACALLEFNLEEIIRAESIAEQLGVSYAAFRKHFKHATGYAPNDYRIRRRLEASQHSLIHTSVKETARKYGYFDAFAYSTQFKRYIGMSPREFQRQMQHSFVPKTLAPRRAKQ